MPYSGSFTVEEKRPVFWIYAALLANVVLLFHKSLFSTDYLFPWDFRGVQLPPITFLADQLREGRFALWNPYVYDGFPVFANIEACYFHPLILLSAFVAAHTSMDALPMLLEWSTVLQIWLRGESPLPRLPEIRRGPRGGVRRSGNLRNRRILRLARAAYRLDHGGRLDAAGVARGAPSR